MHKPSVKQRVLTLLAGMVLLAFTVWTSWAVSPFVALVFLFGSVWFFIWGFKADKPAPKIASIVILSVAVVVLSLTAAYFWWISGYTF